MGDKQGENSIIGEIVGGELQQWAQLPNESAQAYAGFLAYADLPSGQRTIAAAYRQLKGLPEDSDTKPPGYFGAWASKHSWRQRAAAREQVMDRLAVVATVREREVADKRTAEQSARIQRMIDTELDALEQGKGNRWKLGGGTVDKAQTLAQLAAALKDATAARLMALGRADPTQD